MAKQSKFGTFGGVFVPSILTILGVIMYLRLPTIIGEAGLWVTLGIIVVAHIISATTGLSVSSIATDKKVEAGGTYFMISRSLGLPIGGTIGIALFVGLSFSVSLYLIGFSESLLSSWDTVAIFDNQKDNIRLVGTIILLIITVVTFISTSLAIKTQYIILGLIILSIISIISGIGGHNSVATEPTLHMNPDSKFTIMVLFGIFFPAVTGFEAGVSMSGDLKDPKKSIPGGSIMAIVVGFVVYVGLAIFLAYTVDSGLLRDNSDRIPLLDIAWIPELVLAGIFGATISSALGSILGAPRILQATAVDKITPRIFSKGSGKTNEPRNALLLTFAIAEIGILIGELDAIARIVSIFFITTYGFLNISAAFEKWTSADFRPEFKISGWISVIGAVACIIVMVQLDPLAMLGAVVLLGSLFLYLKNRELKLESGDAWSGVWASLVKTGLARLTKNKPHNRNWRPNVIMFSGNPNTRKYMIQMGKALSGQLGMLSAFELVEGGSRILAKTSSNLHEEKDTMGYFHYKFSCRDVYAGMDSISRVYGFSGVEPNTILMGWSRNPRSKEQFINLLKGFDQNGYSSVFLDYHLERKFGKHKTVDIWWSGRDKNLSFAMNIIQHLAASEIWPSCQTRLKIINPVASEKENVYRATKSILKGFRIDAEVVVIDNEIDPRTRKEIISQDSADTDLVILGISDTEYKKLDDYYDEISDILDTVGSSLVINASKVFEEFEVVSTVAPKTSVQATSAISISLPELRLSKYKEVANDISTLEKNGLLVLELFYRKTFSQVVRDHHEIIDEMLKRIDVVKNELVKIKELAEQVRRKKAIDKLKNDAFFKISTLLQEGLSGETLENHQDQLGEGIEWYVDRLKAELKKIPSSLKITYEEADFESDKNDRTGLSLMKTSKKIKHKFIGLPVTQNINYQNAAKYYQYQNRIIFLKNYLEKFMSEEISFFDQVRSISNGLFASLDNFERKIVTGAEDWYNLDSLIELEKTIQNIKTEKYNLDRVRMARLKLEFVKNLQTMNDDLSKVDVDHIIKSKLLKDRFTKEAEATIASFNENYATRLQTSLNLILMELSVNATKNRMDAIQDAFLAELRQLTERKYLRELQNLTTKLETEKRIPEQDKTAIGVDIQPQIREMFSNSIVRMLPLIEEMPEKLEIFSANSTDGEPESVEIPVNRMMEYYFKSQYQVPQEQEFEKLADSLKRSAYSVRDVINLTEVNLESNVLSDQSNQDEELLTDASKKINQEISTVKELLTEFEKQTAEKFEAVFLPLASVRIEDSSNQFSTGLMAYQSQQVLTGANRILGSVAEFFQNSISQLFYRRSEGVLITRKIKEAADHRSVTSKMLDFKEFVNPSRSVLSMLPHYYVTLFNGKSSIARDFWIDRPIEEDVFKKALKRYKDGFKGGILVTGGRNSGKSAFCKQMAMKHLKNQYVYSVFPPVQGSSTIEDFSKAIAKATQKRGDAMQVLGRIPTGSTIIINDLELFWDKGEGGNEVIRLLTELIDQYSHKILFFININPFAWRIIEEANQLSQYFIEEITMMPFDAEELKNLILHRHRSSGMSVSFDTAEEPLSEVQFARLFNRYFNYSKGVPGTALGGWLANVKKISNGKMIVKKPEPLDISSFKDISEEWGELLKNLIIHKRMGKEKIARVLNWDIGKTETILLALQRAGLVVEKIPGVYQVDSYIHPFVTESFKDRNLLYT